MENNQKFMSLDIQLFAEPSDESMANADAVNTANSASNDKITEQKEKTYSRDELNKIVSAEKAKLREELLQEAKVKQTEAEKLAKMDAEQKLNYELDKKTKENEELKNEINSLTLQTQANTLATEKGLPLGYLKDWDFTKETAESVAEKIDNLAKTRSADLEAYLKDKLKQNPPKAIGDDKESLDPYIEGFKKFMKKK